MATYDFTRLKRQILIQRVVQLFLFVMLVVVALQFTAKLASSEFLRVTLFSLALQLILYYPLNRLAAAEVEREVATAETGLSIEQLNAVRRRRVFADYIKGAVFIFFATFIVLAPAAPIVLALIIFTFILTALSYFQYFNFAAKRRMSA